MFSYTSREQQAQDRYPQKPLDCTIVNSCVLFSMARQGGEPRFPKFSTGAFPAKPVICILFASCLACSTPCCTYVYNSSCELRRNLYLIVFDICRSFKNAMILASVPFQVRINEPMCQIPSDVLCLKKATFQNGSSFQIYFFFRKIVLWFGNREAQQGLQHKTDKIRWRGNVI